MPAGENGGGMTSDSTVAPGNGSFTLQQAKRLRQVDETKLMFAGLFRRLYTSPERVSPRQAIRAFCLECNGYEREAITVCSATACPLFFFRPFQQTQRERRAANKAKEAA